MDFNQEVEREKGFASSDPEPNYSIPWLILVLLGIGKRGQLCLDFELHICQLVLMLQAEHLT